MQYAILANAVADVVIDKVLKLKQISDIENGALRKKNISLLSQWREEIVQGIERAMGNLFQSDEQVIILDDDVQKLKDRGRVDDVNSKLAEYSMSRIEMVDFLNPVREKFNDRLVRRVESLSQDYGDEVIDQDEFERLLTELRIKKDLFNEVCDEWSMSNIRVEGLGND